MADGIILNTGTGGSTVATDDAGAAGHVQLFKLAISTDGSATLVPCTVANGILVDVSRVTGTVTTTLDAAALAALETIELGATTLAALESITIGTALPAGTNAIGKLAANSGVDIGDVGVTDLPSYLTPTSTATAGAGTANCTTTTSEAVATNSSRLGLQIINDSDTIAYLGLGTSALANRGIRLNANGGTWDGKISGVLWRGAVNSIHGGAGTKILAYIEL